MKAFIFGAGAQGRVVLDTLRAQGGYESIAFLDDDPAVWGKQINGVPVAGNLEQVRGLPQAAYGVIVALGDPIKRLAVARKVREHGSAMLNAIHPSAVIMASARLGQGNAIEPLAVLSANVTVADCTIVNTCAIIEHDTVIAEGATIGSGAMVGGRCRIERAAFICASAVILPRVVVGAGSIVAAGSIVTHDVPDGVLVMGAPARTKERVGADFDWTRVL
jgi:UDP-perosamine 4-acetyltransferase